MTDFMYPSEDSQLDSDFITVRHNEGFVCIVFAVILN